MSSASPFNDDQFSPAADPRPGEWLPFQSSRVSQARYDSGLGQVHVVFRDGTPWVYDGVPRNVWNNFRRSSSPGKFINRVLNNYPYWQGADFDTADGQAPE